MPEEKFETDTQNQPADVQIETDTQNQQADVQIETPLKEEQDGIAALASSLGFDKSELESFDSPEAAKEAIGNYLQQVAKTGKESGEKESQSTPAHRQNVPTGQVSQELWKITAEQLGLEDGSPEFQAVQKYDSLMQPVFKALAAELQSVTGDIRSIKEGMSVTSPGLESKVNETIDSLDPKEFGRGGHSNRFQDMNRRRLAEIASNIARGYRVSEQALPPMSSLMAMAHTVYQRETGRTGSNGKPAPKAKQKTETVLSTSSPGSDSNGQSGGNPYRGVQWSQNPEIRGKLGM